MRVTRLSRLEYYASRETLLAIAWPRDYRGPCSQNSLNIGKNKAARPILDEGETAIYRHIWRESLSPNVYLIAAIDSRNEQIERVTSINKRFKKYENLRYAQSHLLLVFFFLDRLTSFPRLPRILLSGRNCKSYLRTDPCQM